MKILLIAFVPFIFFTKGYSQQNNPCITSKMYGIWKQTSRLEGDTINFALTDTIERNTNFQYININNDSLFPVHRGIIRCGVGLPAQDPFGHWEISKTCIARFYYAGKTDTLNSYGIALSEDTRLTFIKIK